MSYSAALLLVAGCIAIETTEQSLYRMAGRHRKRFLIHVAPAIGLHMCGLVLWFWLLKRLPLGEALPLMGANFVTIALVGRIAFREKIDWRRWSGIGLIVAGFILVAMNAA